MSSLDASPTRCKQTQFHSLVWNVQTAQGRSDAVPHVRCPTHTPGSSAPPPGLCPPFRQHKAQSGFNVMGLRVGRDQLKATLTPCTPVLSLHPAHSLLSQSMKLPIFSDENTETQEERATGISWRTWRRKFCIYYLIPKTTL